MEKKFKKTGPRKSTASFSAMIDPPHVCTLDFFSRMNNNSLYLHNQLLVYVIE